MIYLSETIENCYLYTNSSPKMIFFWQEKNMLAENHVTMQVNIKNFYSMIKSFYARFYIRKMCMPKNHAMENHVRRGWDCCITLLYCKL